MSKKTKNVLVRALGLLLATVAVLGLYSCAQDGPLFSESLSGRTQDAGQPLSSSEPGTLQSPESAAALESRGVNSLSCWHYDRLSPAERTLYLEMYDIVAAFGAEGPLSPASKEEIDAAFCALCADHPELFWLESYGGTYSSRGGEVVSVTFRPGYSITAEEWLEKNRLLEENTADLLDSVPEGDDYGKALYLYKALVTTTAYEANGTTDQSLYGCLVQHSAVCAGYARAMQYLLNRAGLTATYVSGSAGGESHAWNLVLLDGAWYHLDVTWGDTDTVRPDGSELVHYEYFTMTTADMLADHAPAEDIWPLCTSRADLYFTREGTALDAWDTVQAETLLTEAAVQHAPAVCLAFSTQESYEAACAAVTNGDIYILLDHARRAAPALLPGEISYYRNDARRVLNLILSYGEEG